MPDPPLRISNSEMENIESMVDTTINQGAKIRKILANNSKSGPYDTKWEVEASVESLHVFGKRWTIEILSTLYITGPRRFNQLKKLLTGISSRTLSDKLRFLADEGLVVRQVDDGPPSRVQYILSEHGTTCGRLLSPLVAHLKIKNGSVKTRD
tara:strand:- start:6479 stop:6937 length:459 start_codon:yes stop_codon:yes gene_type:complete